MMRMIGEGEITKLYGVFLSLLYCCGNLQGVRI